MRVQRLPRFLRKGDPYDEHVALTLKERIAFYEENIPGIRIDPRV